MKTKVDTKVATLKLGRPPMPASKRREHAVMVRFNQADYRKLKRAAKEKGKTLAMAVHNAAIECGLGS